MALTEDVLKAAYSVANSRAEWATGIVTVGVVIELIALLLFGKEMPRNEKIALAIGSILVVLGVGGEWVFGSRASAIAVQIQQASDEKIAGLARDQEGDRKTATRAAAYAASLGVSVGNLRDFVGSQVRQDNETLAALKRNTTDLNKARDDAVAASNDAKKTLAIMAAANEPRGSSINKTSFVEHLKPFHDTVVSVWRFQTISTDAAPLAIGLTQLLTAANWKARGVSVSFGSGFAKGIIVLKRSDANASVAKAVVALVDELKKDGLAAGTAEDFVGAGGDAFGNGMIVAGPIPDIIVVVGDKT